MHLVPGDADGSKPFELAMDVVLLRAYKEVVGIPHMEFYAQMTEEASSACDEDFHGSSPRVCFAAHFASFSRPILAL